MKRLVLFLLVMVELMDPQADDLICDPAAGTAGFLVESAEYLQTKKKNEIFFTKENKDYFNKK